MPIGSSRNWRGDGFGVTIADMMGTISGLRDPSRTAANSMDLRGLEMPAPGTAHATSATSHSPLRAAV
jgi:hypothetical protein